MVWQSPDIHGSFHVSLYAQNIIVQSKDPVGGLAVSGPTCFMSFMLTVCVLGF